MRLPTRCRPDGRTPWPPWHACAHPRQRESRCCGRTPRSTGIPPWLQPIRGGADVSITVRLDLKVKAAIADIGADAWTTIEYTDAVYDETTQ